MKKRTVAVIGGGIFGCEIAIQLGNVGYDVTLFEKNSCIMNNATANSQNRLHLGLHYPRDLNTAIQSKKGSREFEERFPDSVRKSFPNIYLVASKNSKINSVDFKNFARKANIEITQIKDMKSLPFGTKSENIESGWVCDEGVIDIRNLREQIKFELNRSRVKLILNCTVERVELSNKIWSIFTKEKQNSSFDFIIRATYGTDRITSNAEFWVERKFEYHKTIIARVKSDEKPYGVTIVDGDFITILPEGFSNNFLIYSPSASRMMVNDGNSYPLEWDSFNKESFDRHLNMIIEKSKFWFPDFKIKHLLEPLVTVRAVKYNSTETDERITEITKMQENFFDVWAGKIDHCVETANQIAELLST